MRTIAFALSIALMMSAPLLAREKPEKINDEQRALLIREFMSEFGQAVLLIPRSGDPLAISPQGTHNEEEWAAAMEKNGPAAREGDLIEITKLEFKGKQLVFELNHGIKGGRKWWHRVQVSGNSSGTMLGDIQDVYAPGGTKLAVIFENDIPPITADEVKEILRPFLDFRQRSATEIYMERLPEEIQEAIKEERVMDGMDQDMVLLAKGMPDNKYRETKNGVDREDWIYGVPPGNVTFVTFEDGQVVEIKDSYATVGGDVKTREDIEEEIRRQP